MPSAASLRERLDMKEWTNEHSFDENLSLDSLLQNDIHRFVRQICVGIRSARARSAAEDELFDHIHGALYDATLRGIPPERAWPDICASFGNPAILRQQLAGVHNRLPPDFFPALGRFSLRLVVAVLVTGFLWGLIGSSGSVVGGLVGVLILCGLWPLRAVGCAWNRLCFHGRLWRLGRRNGWEILRFPSIGKIFFARPAALYVVRTGEGVPLTVIRHLSVSHPESLRFVDETSLLRIRRRRGVGLADQRPGQFNLIKTAALGHETIRPASFSYLLPPELVSSAENTTAPRVEKLLVVDRFPRDVSVVSGNSVREVIPGDRVFDFAVHSRASCVAYLLGSQSE